MNMGIAHGNYDLIMQMADANQEFAEDDAQQALLKGEREGENNYRKGAALKGMQIAAYAASGVAVDSDSAIRVLSTTDWQTETDADTIKQNAAREAMGYRVNGLLNHAQAQMQATNVLTNAMGEYVGAKVANINETTQAENYANGQRTGAAFDNLNTMITAGSQAINMISEADDSALNTRATAAINALNIRTGSTMDSINSQTQAATFRNQANGLTVTGNSISPTLIGAAGAVNTVSSVLGIVGKGK